MRNPFFAACVAATIFGLAVGLGMGLRNAPDPVWDSKLAEWLDAIGSAAAAGAAVWLGLRAFTKQHRDERGRAELVAYLIVLELERAAWHFTDMRLLSGEAEFAWVTLIYNDTDCQRMASEWDSRRLNNTRGHLFELIHFPGTLGRHVASLVPYFDHVAAEFHRAASLDREKRWKVLQPLLSDAMRDAEEINATAAAVRAVMEGEHQEAERLIAKVDRLSAATLKKVQAERQAFGRPVQEASPEREHASERADGASAPAE